MNKKGMTLIEMIMALTILAIASLMILTGFMSVSHILSQANERKEASDILLSYAEQSIDPQIINQVTTVNAYASYTMKNNRGTSVKGDLRISELNVKTANMLPLSMVHGIQFGKVKDNPDYQAANRDGNAYYDAINALVAITDPQNLFTNFPKTLYIDTYHGQWDTFTNALLPMRMQQSAGTYHIVGAFPWDYFSGRDANHGGLLIYLSQNYQGEIPEITQEAIHVVYDYIDQKWYYYEGDDYVIAYHGYDDFEPKFIYQGKQMEILSFEELRKYMKAPNGGWRILDEESEFHVDDPDASWKQLD